MFSEALLEFEESLAEMAVSPNTIMLNYLDLKADLNRHAVASSSDDSSSHTDIEKIFAEYDYFSDEVTLCSGCRVRLSEGTSNCCLSHVQNASHRIPSGVEKDYWDSFFENTYKTLLALPNYSRVVFFQKGVPYQLRPIIWQKLIMVNHKNNTGVPLEAKVLFRNFQHSYNRDISNQIKKDLSRTFPYMNFFSDPNTVDSLLTILNVYANYDLDLGYCQGLLFLVGTLFYQFKEKEGTFHALCKIMECETELRSIFVPTTMSPTLDKWYREFLTIFTSIDEELATHLASFCDYKVFLYQWWLSLTLIHAPDFTVNNRIVDFCLTEGWKVGVLKISVGLLLCNRPILISFGDGDEEVVYQHLLNESKWGNVINDSAAFFGDLLLSMDESLFTISTCDTVPPLIATSKIKYKKSRPTVFGILRNLTIKPTCTSESDASIGSATSHPSAESFTQFDNNRSHFSLFSTTKDSESIASTATSLSWDRSSRGSNIKGSLGDVCSISFTVEDLTFENQTLRALLKRAYTMIDNEELKHDIENIFDV